MLEDAGACKFLVQLDQKSDLEVLATCQDLRFKRETMSCVVQQLADEKHPFLLDECREVKDLQSASLLRKPAKGLQPDTLWINPCDSVLTLRHILTWIS